MKPVRAAIVFVAALTVGGLLGCAPTSTEGSSQVAPGASGKGRGSAADAAQGPKIAGTGYTFKAPKGWTPPKQDIPGFDFDSVALDYGDRDGFSDNINVLVSPNGAVALSRVEEGAMSEMAMIGARRPEVHDRVVVAGERTAHTSAVMSQNGEDYVVEQYFPTTDDQTYIVTFSFSPSRPRRARERLAESVLSTWTWTK